jgi:uncharacterized protein (DUF3084 family)
VTDAVDVLVKEMIIMAKPSQEQIEGARKIAQLESAIAQMEAQLSANARTINAKDEHIIALEEVIEVKNERLQECENLFEALKTPMDYEPETAKAGAAVARASKLIHYDAIMRRVVR